MAASRFDAEASSDTEFGEPGRDCKGWLEKIRWERGGQNDWMDYN